MILIIWCDEYMASIKDSVIAFLKDLPDNVSIDEIMYHLYVKQKIIRGKQQIDDGHTHTHEEVEELSKAWLK